MTSEEETSELGFRLVRKGGYPALCGFSRRSGEGSTKPETLPSVGGEK